MKHVKMMYLKSCPYCKQAFAMMEELKQNHPEYQSIEIEEIEEQMEEEKTAGYDYWYVPTYFVDDIKVHEGIPSVEKLEEVLKQASM
ncbi:thioredoxin family protein [Amedibacillus sp. YH-ame10]